MAREKKAHHIFDVYIGGIFAEPIKTETGSEASPTEARKELVELLNKSKDIVKGGGGLKQGEPSDENWSFGDGIIGEAVKDEFQCITYSWTYPLVFKLGVHKGFEFKDSYERHSKTLGPIEAFILYNGIWFMALVDTNQFPTIEEHFSSGPDIRDILVTILERNELFVPIVVPPCIIPRSFKVELHNKESRDKKHLPKYISTSRYEDAPSFTVKYQTETVNVTDKDMVGIMTDIYFDLVKSLDSFYILAAKSNRAQDKHRDILETYEQLCGNLQEYTRIPSWNIFKRNRVASALSKTISNIQVQLVNNRLSQVRILNEAQEINTMEDTKGIIKNIRGYLKECVVKDFDLGTVEYEGLTATLSHIERLTSQHNIILVSLIAIAAGFIGAVIGGWIG